MAVAPICSKHSCSSFRRFITLLLLVSPTAPNTSFAVLRVHQRPAAPSVELEGITFVGSSLITHLLSVVYIDSSIGKRAQKSRRGRRGGGGGGARGLLSYRCGGRDAGVTVADHRRRHVLLCASGGIAAAEVPIDCGIHVCAMRIRVVGASRWVSRWARAIMIGRVRCDAAVVDTEDCTPIKSVIVSIILFVGEACRRAKLPKPLPCGRVSGCLCSERRSRGVHMMLLLLNVKTLVRRRRGEGAGRDWRGLRLHPHQYVRTGYAAGRGCAVIIMPNRPTSAIFGGAHLLLSLLLLLQEALLLLLLLLLQHKIAESCVRVRGQRVEALENGNASALLR